MVNLKLLAKRLSLGVALWRWAGFVLPFTALGVIIMTHYFDWDNLVQSTFMAIIIIMATVMVGWWWWALTAIHRVLSIMVNTEENLVEVKKEIAVIREELPVEEKIKTS